MELLEQRIRQDGKVKGTSILKVDSFLNHQMDIELFSQMGQEFFRLFGDCGVNKILTIEASGIGMACVTAQYFHCPVVFAKKNMSSNISDHVYSAPVKSFTHGNQYNAIVSKEYLHPEDRILVIDDFLAMGEALRGLFSLVQQSGATLIGAGIAVEKAFQPGGAQLRSEGYRIESLARVAAMSEEGGVVFAR